MGNKAVVSLSTGLEDAEKVTVAMLVAVGAAESGRPTLMFLTKESVRLVTGHRHRHRMRRVPANRRFDGSLRHSRRPVSRVPHLLQRQAPRRSHARRGRQPRRHRAHVGVDRRRGGHDLQLLTALGGSLDERFTLAESVPSGAEPSARN
jgi:hypothetical protein